MAGGFLWQSLVIPALFFCLVVASVLFQKRGVAGDVACLPCFFLPACPPSEKIRRGDERRVLSTTNPTLLTFNSAALLFFPVVLSIIPSRR